ncbi:MAG: hypothetical protein IMW85_08205, partial [Thermicanus sp.]|nr:hypothetical protein [Thermicanus sp.]
MLREKERHLFAGKVKENRNALKADFTKEEKGYTLVTVLLLFLAISFILMSMLELSVTSHSSVAAQENLLRARQNAENGTLEATAKLQNEINALNNQLSNANVDVIKSQLNGIYQKISANTPEYEYKIDNTTREELGYDSANGLYSEKVEIVTVGKSGSSRQTYRKTLVLSTVADIFNYAVVTPGTLSLNGAPYVEGDLYVEGDVNITNKSTFNKNYDLLSIPLYKNSIQVQTSYPALNGKLSVKGNIKGEGRILEKTPQGISNYFSISPSLKVTDLSIQKIDVKKEVNKNSDYGKAHGPDLKKVKPPFGSKTYEESVRIKDSLEIHSGMKITVMGDLLIDDNLEIEEGGELEVT